tara:strand:- start:631 stop:1380 length:750 start_codon:yes stop_codon:yes gene_type:complete
MEENLRERILIIDDKPLVLRSLVRVIRGPYDIDTATNLGEAKELLSKNSYSVVVSDNNISGKNTNDGLGLFQELSVGNHPAARYLLSGKEVEYERLRGKAHAFSGKPVDVSRLRALTRGLSTRQTETGNGVLVYLEETSLLEQIQKALDGIEGLKIVTDLDAAFEALATNKYRLAIGDIGNQTNRRTTKRVERLLSTRRFGGPGFETVLYSGQEPWGLSQREGFNLHISYDEIESRLREGIKTQLRAFQ